MFICFSHLVLHTHSRLFPFIHVVTAQKSFSFFFQVRDFYFQCSKDCGGGQKYRKVRCQQLLALGEIANKPDNHCPRPRPEQERSCNSQVCSSYDYEKMMKKPNSIYSPSSYSSNSISIEGNSVLQNLLKAFLISPQTDQGLLSLQYYLKLLMIAIIVIN